MIIHEIENPLPVHTPHGPGKAIFLYEYSIDINTVFGVRLDSSGEYKHYYSEDIRIYANPMNGEKTEIPKGWKK
jgi:hypothetical protein